MTRCTDPVLINVFGLFSLHGYLVIFQYGTHTFEYLVMNNLISINEWFLNNCDLYSRYCSMSAVNICTHYQLLNHLLLLFIVNYP